MSYHPIGTVVTLKGGNVPIMIDGRQPLQTDKDKIWDYAACLYPQGNIGKGSILFNHDQIDKIHHLGLVCELEEKMLEVIEQTKRPKKVIMKKDGTMELKY